MQWAYIRIKLNNLKTDVRIEKSPIPYVHQRKCMTLKLKCLIETKLTSLRRRHPKPTGSVNAAHCQLLEAEAMLLGKCDV